MAISSLPSTTPPHMDKPRSDDVVSSHLFRFISSFSCRAAIIPAQASSSLAPIKRNMHLDPSSPPPHHGICSLPLDGFRRCASRILALQYRLRNQNRRFLAKTVVGGAQHNVRIDTPHPAADTASVTLGLLQCQCHRHIWVNGDDLILSRYERGWPTWSRDSSTTSVKST